ncbi:uncharacterized protein EI97DRAFT_432207 [Westerdykella ornata]|uniref:C2H2-type domain-containing protein n=1 Tax=Westerdykella ornata TaxID=318751 RepID=A0A6A6JLE9_WESOR|nr:uncharacterized protein EI97DRAFT_432207 [Westerdykella ornata]KAF2277332.1 hypothetical protein EI97DRAFT_432207 [Westerdykella ornata]
MAAPAAGAAYFAAQDLDLPPFPFSPPSPIQPVLTPAPPPSTSAITAPSTTSPPPFQTIPTPDPSGIDRSCPLSLIPSNIQIHRNTFFALDAPLLLSAWAWDAYWSYIDNVGCLHAKPGSRHPSVKNGFVRVYGARRLWRKRREGEGNVNANMDGGVEVEEAGDGDGNANESWNGSGNPEAPPAGKRNVPRRIHNAGTCPAKFRMTLYEDGRRTLERTSVEGHTHLLDEVDALKRNSGVRGLLLEPVFEFWDHTSILAYLRDGAGRNRDYGDLFIQAGGLYLDQKEVTNVMMRGKTRRLPPGVAPPPVGYVRSQMERYKGLMVCTCRGCREPLFPDVKALLDHRKKIHGFKSHDHSGERFVYPVRGCRRKKRSQGFVSRERLLMHMSGKHGWVEEGMMAHVDSRDGNVYSDMEGGFVTGSDDDDDEANEEEEDAEGQEEFEHNVHPLLTEHPTIQEQEPPITPASSTTSDANQHSQVLYSMQQQHHHPVSNLAGGLPRTLTLAQKRQGQARIQSLMARREKLDAEIAGLHAIINEADNVQLGARPGQNGSSRILDR